LHKKKIEPKKGAHHQGNEDQRANTVQLRLKMEAPKECKKKRMSKGRLDGALPSKGGAREDPLQQMEGVGGATD